MKAYSALVATLCIVAIAASPACAEEPAWWGNDLGTAPMVLPGFASVRVDGTRVDLFARSYVWENSFLPARIESLGRRLTGPLELVASVGGQRVPLVPESVEVVEKRAAAVTVRASGRPLPGLAVTATTRVEYDGVAMVTLELVPDRPVAVGGLVNEVRVARNEWSRLVAFQATANPSASENARNAMKQAALVATPARGAFRNVLGFPDGDRSFWWFADNAEGWIWNGPVVTEVLEEPEHFLVRQHLIGADWRIEKPMTLRFNFLATPVRDLGSKWREERVTSRPPEDSGESGRFNYWWQEALAWPVLPYTVVPPEVRAARPDIDFDARPTRDQIRRKMRAYEARGFQRLPYFSSHCLAEFDPALVRYRDPWEVEPPWVAHWGPTPTPCLSHRAEGYTDYLLHRIAAVVDEIDTPGIYFDQAAILDSRNPAHGAWTDSNGRTQASLDILANRAFLKRLRVLFFEKGQPGTIVTHNSGSQVIPTFTFTGSNLDGEQFRQPGRLKNEDYIASIPLEEFRSLYAGGQYGVLNTWLPVTWSFHSKDEDWEGSAAQLRSYRSLMALALLHDTPILPVGVSRTDWDATNRILDRFGVGASDFVGYWNLRHGLAAKQADAPVSYYRRKDGSAALLVIANLQKLPRTVDVPVDPDRVRIAGDSFVYAAHPLPAKSLPADGAIRVSVPGRNFALVELRRAP